MAQALINGGNNWIVASFYLICIPAMIWGFFLYYFDALVGATLSLDSGDGPVRLAVRRPANPCAWMDVAAGPGTWKSLRRRGGIRCRPLDDGILRVGPVEVEVTWPPGA